MAVFVTDKERGMYVMLVPRKARVESYEEFVRDFMVWWEEQLSKRNGKVTGQPKDRIEG